MRTQSESCVRLHRLRSKKAATLPMVAGVEVADGLVAGVAMVAVVAPKSKTAKRPGGRTGFDIDVI